MMSTLIAAAVCLSAVGVQAFSGAALEAAAEVISVEIEPMELAKVQDDWFFPNTFVGGNYNAAEGRQTEPGTAEWKKMANYMSPEGTTGHVSSVAFAGTNSQVAYSVAVGKGLFKTSNIDADSPDWEFIDIPGFSSSQAAVAVDTENPNIVVVASGSVSTISQYQSKMTGITMSRDGGKTWALMEVPNDSYVGFREVRSFDSGNTVVACAATQNLKMYANYEKLHNPGFATSGGVYVSYGGGAFTQVFGAGDPINCRDLTAWKDDQSSEHIIYAAIPTKGLLRSFDTAKSWSFVNLTTALNETFISDQNPDNANMRCSVQHVEGSTVICYTMPSKDSIKLPDGWDHYDDFGKIIRVTDADTSASTPEVLPGVSYEGKNIFGWSEGNQLFIHGAVVCDPNVVDVFYVGYTSLPGFAPFNTTIAPGSGGFIVKVHATDDNAFQFGSWVPIVGTYNGELDNGVHSDFSNLYFRQGTLIAASDGGLYANANPYEGSPWFGKQGNMNNLEVQVAAYEPNNKALVSAAQDCGVWYTSAVTGKQRQWPDGDGGTAGVTFTEGTGTLVYGAIQLIQDFNRREWIDNAVEDSLFSYTDSVVPSLTPQATGIVPDTYLCDYGKGMTFDVIPAQHPTDMSRFLQNTACGAFQISEGGTKFTQVFNVTETSVYMPDKYQRGALKFGHPDDLNVAYQLRHTRLYRNHIAANGTLSKSVNVEAEADVGQYLPYIKLKSDQKTKCSPTGFCVDPYNKDRVLVLGPMQHDNFMCLYGGPPSSFMTFMDGTFDGYMFTRGLPDQTTLNDCQWIRGDNMKSVIVLATTDGVFTADPEEKYWFPFTYGMKPRNVMAMTLQIPQGHLLIPTLGAGAKLLHDSHDILSHASDFKLVTTSPKDGDVLPDFPTKIVLTFSEAPALAGKSGIILVNDQTGVRKDVTKLTKSQGSSLVIDLNSFTTPQQHNEKWEIFHLEVHAGAVVSSDSSKLSVPFGGTQMDTMSQADGSIIRILVASQIMGDNPSAVSGAEFVPDPQYRVNQQLAKWSVDGAKCTFQRWQLEVFTADGEKWPHAYSYDTLTNRAVMEANVLGLVGNETYSLTVTEICARR